MPNTKKFLDASGLTYLVSKLDDYPTNEILSAVIDGIDEVKADIDSPTLTGTPVAPTATAGTNTTQIATTAFVNTAVNNSKGETIDMSSYTTNATVPVATVTKLLNINNNAKYGDNYYALASDFVDTSTSSRVLMFTGINNLEGGSGFYLYLVDGTTDWKFGGLTNIVLVEYDADNILNIKINNSSSSLRIQDDSHTIRIYKSSSQNADTALELPSASGKIALISDISAANDPTYAQVIAALGFTPYNSTNPNGYITGITSSNVIAALGYTPYNSTNPNGYISSITNNNVVTALGYTPYNATNPNRYISSISGTDVTDALGYTPYNSSNPSNYVSGTTTALTNYYTKTQVDGMVANRFQALIVSALPASNISTSTIYMIQDTVNENSYDEWMYISSTWTKIGSTSIDMSEYAKTADLHNVAITGSYASLVGKPTIPSDTASLTNSAGFITKSVNNLDNYTATTDLATVATTGDYEDLNNQPSIPTAVSQLTNDSNFLNPTTLAQQNVSTLINDANYATLNDVSALENIDVDEINRAIAAMDNVGTVTSVTAGTGLTGGGTTAVTLNHSNSVTAVSGYPSGTSLSNGGSFIVRDVQYDAQGHITGSQNRTINMTAIPAYDDTTVRGLINTEVTARTATDARVTAIESSLQSQFTPYVFCIFGIEPYIDPDTMTIVADRYYQRSDVDTGIFMDSNKIDIHLKAWLKYHYNITSLDYLKNTTCYVYAMGDHGKYVNHMVTFWSQMNNPSITSYPHLQQVGMFVDDGYGSVHRFTTEEVGAILSSSDDGYISADPTGSGKGYVSGWNTLLGRVDDLEDRPQYDPSDTSPIINGTAAAGVATTWSRSDHVHPIDTTREAISNKVTSWSATTTDTHYPSEKLVKTTTDALDTRVSTLENTATIVYIGSSAPSTSIGDDGDLYVQQ